VGAELNEILADRADVVAAHTPWRHRARDMYNSRQDTDTDRSQEVGETDGEESGEMDGEP
jgi:hypothetical protein